VLHSPMTFLLTSVGQCGAWLLRIDELQYRVEVGEIGIYKCKVEVVSCYFLNVLCE